jgi:signal transduction histidine kinase
MTESRPSRSPIEPPSVARPPAFADRRTRYRRQADRVADRETALLARSLDILASGDDAESRLAGILDLLARTAGARHAAILAEGTDRRVAVAIVPGEDPAAAKALGRWLDATAERSRARRAASAPAPVLVTTIARAAGTTPAPPDDPAQPASPVDDPIRAVLPIAGLPDVALGFDFADAQSAEQLPAMLPPTMARHAAVALALVTEQLILERELATLRASATERSGFISTVAHELRTPLTGLSGYLDLILGDKVADKAVEREFLERGRQIVDSMGELVGDLLELSRLEAGSLRLELTQFSVAEAVGRVAAGLHPIALERQIELVSSMPPRLRAATGDPRRVEQVITNIVANALKFTASGRRVELAAWFDGMVALIAVRDEGPGIAPDDRARVFERFYRMAAHERITGTGLGLSIARELARAMGGDLEVASVPGSGSSFVLALPGPAPMDAAAVDATLARVLLAEEIALEERAVLRAMQLAGRSISRPA